MKYEKLPDSFNILLRFYQEKKKEETSGSSDNKDGKNKRR